MPAERPARRVVPERPGAGSRQDIDPAVIAGEEFTVGKLGTAS